MAQSFVWSVRKDGMVKDIVLYRTQMDAFARADEEPGAIVIARDLPGKKRLRKDGPLENVILKEYLSVLGGWRDVVPYFDSITDKRQLNYYEMLREDHPAHLYLDIDGRIENASDLETLNREYEQLKVELEKFIRAKHPVDSVRFVELSALGPGKFSYHLIVKVISEGKPMIFKDVYEHMKRYMSHFLAGTATVHPLFRSMVDLSVYSRNRCYRLVGNCKYVEDPNIAPRFFVLCGEEVPFEDTLASLVPDDAKIVTYGPSMWEGALPPLLAKQLGTGVSTGKISSKPLRRDVTNKLLKECADAIARDIAQYVRHKSTDTRIEIIPFGAGATDGTLLFHSNSKFCLVKAEHYGYDPDNPKCKVAPGMAYHEGNQVYYIADLKSTPPCWYQKCHSEKPACFGPDDLGGTNIHRRSLLVPVSDDTAEKISNFWVTHYSLADALVELAEE